MGCKRNKAGQWARRIAEHTRSKRKVVAYGGAIAILLCLPFILMCVGLGIIGLGVVGIVGIVVLIVVINAISSTVESRAKAYRGKEQRAERGARAEEAVEEVLRQLKGPYDVFNDVDTGYGDIDHILLSRGHGVFVLETKSHSGKVTVHNEILLIDEKQPEKDFIDQAFRNTMWLKRRIKETTGLDPWVQPIIVFTHAFVQEWRPVRSILVRNKKYLVSTIEKTRANQTTTARLWTLHEQGKSLW